MGATCNNLLRWWLDERTTRERTPRDELQGKRRPAGTGGERARAPTKLSTACSYPPRAVFLDAAGRAPPSSPRDSSQYTKGSLHRASCLQTTCSSNLVAAKTVSAFSH